MAKYGTHEEKRHEKTHDKLYDKLWPEIQVLAKKKEKRKLILGFFFNFIIDGN